MNRPEGSLREAASLPVDASAPLSGAGASAVIGTQDHKADDAGDRALALVLRGGMFLAAGLLGAALAASLLFRIPLVVVGGFLTLPQEGGMAAAVAIAARLGILLLGLTPVARVALSVPIFARAGERSQALIGLGVLVLLVLSMLLGAVES